MPPSITYTSSVVARSGSSPTSRMRRAVSQEPTRNAVRHHQPERADDEIADPEQLGEHTAREATGAPAAGATALADGRRLAARAA